MWFQLMHPFKDGLLGNKDVSYNVFLRYNTRLNYIQKAEM